MCACVCACVCVCVCVCTTIYILLLCTSTGSPVADISHKVTQGEILCSTQDSTTYPGDRYCLYVEESGGERHEVKCDDHPVSGDVEELMKLGNTAVCTVNRTTTGSVPNRIVSNEVTHTMTGECVCGACLVEE